MKRLGLAAATFAAIFALAGGALALTRGGEVVAPLWPANALALVVLLRLAHDRADRAVVLGALFAASVAANVLWGFGGLSAVPFSLIDVGEVALAASLVWRTGGLRLRSLSDGWRLFALAGPPASAAGALASLAVGAALGLPDAPRAAATWLAADLLGFLLVAPLGMTVSRRELARLQLRRRWPEALGLALAVLAGSAVCVLQPGTAFLFVVAPLVLLATFRFRLVGAGVATVLVSLVATPLTVAGPGPAAAAQAHGADVRVLVLQLFLGMTELTAVAVAAALADRDAAAAVARRRSAEQSRANAELRLTVQSTEYAERSAGVGYWRLETPSRDFMWSSGVYALLGRAPEAGPVRKPEFLERYAVGDPDALTAAFARAFDASAPASFEFEVRREDGERRRLLSSARFEGDPDGAGLFLGVLVDVTERAAAAEAAAEAEAGFDLLAAHSRDVVVRWGADGTISYVSPSCQRLTGLPPDAFLGRRALHLVHPEDRPAVADALQRLRDTGELTPARIEYRLQHADGSWRWVGASPVLVPARDGGPGPEVLDVLRDIGAARRAADVLAESEARYRLLAENATDVILRFSLDGTASFVSPACERVLGYQTQELIGRRTTEFIHPEDVERIRVQYAEFVRRGPGGPPMETLHRALRKDGKVIWLEGRPVMVLDAEGLPVEFCDVMRDVTARMRMESELVEARQAAEVAARAKDDFLANMSHELRTPLGSILGFSGLVASAPELADETRRRAGLVEDASRSLLTIVNDVLDISRFEAEGVSLDLAPTELAGLLASAAELVRGDAERKRLELRVEAEPGPAVLVDAPRLRQVVLNLLANAVKFTSEGAIVLSLTRDADEKVEIAVADTGVGIAADRLHAVFDRFSQADASTSRRFGGTGLGLAICRTLVEAMDGEIGVESRPGEGSRFHLRLHLPTAPASTADRGAAAEPATPTGRPLKVLVADDNLVNRELFLLLTGGSELVVDTAENGVQALEAVRTRAYDLVFMDVQMPIMDGLEATRAIRAMGHAALPVVALTANVLEAEIERCRAAGMTAHLAKPYTRDEVLAAARRWSRPTPEDAAVQAA